MNNKKFLIRYPDGGKIFCNLYYLLKDLYVDPKFHYSTPLSIFHENEGVLSTKGRSNRPVNPIDVRYNYISPFKNNYFISLTRNQYKVTKAGNLFQVDSIPEELKDGIKLSEKDAAEVYKFFDANGYKQVDRP